MMSLVHVTIGVVFVFSPLRNLAKRCAPPAEPRRPSEPERLEPPRLPQHQHRRQPPHHHHHHHHHHNHQPPPFTTTNPSPGRFLPKPGEGPSRDRMVNGYWNHQLAAVLAQGGPNEPQKVVYGR
jgi:hypothetical protein